MRKCDKKPTLRQSIACLIKQALAYFVIVMIGMMLITYAIIKSSYDGVTTLSITIIDDVVDGTKDFYKRWVK